jgi:protein TonB
MSPHLSHRNSKADALTEMVFEHRHKDYGAYTLRRDYKEHVNKAMLITIGSLCLLLLFSFLLRNLSKEITLMKPDSPIELNKKIYEITPDVSVSATKFKKMVNPVNNNYLVSPIDTDNIPVDTTQSTTTPSDSIGNSRTPTTGTTGRGDGSGKATVVHIDTTNYNRIILVPQRMPEFPGGDEELHRYLTKNIRCNRWLDQGESGTIVFSLVVSRNGTITDVKVEKDDVHFECAEQAIQVIKNMPRWSPGLQNDIPVNVRYYLPVIFQKMN